MAKNALRGTGLGGRPATDVGDPSAWELAPRRRVSFWCGRGHEMRLSFAEDVPHPEEMTCRHCGAPSGLDQAAPPPLVAGVVPFKTHMQYVEERRSADDGEALLSEALERLRAKQGR